MPGSATTPGRGALALTRPRVLSSTLRTVSAPEVVRLSRLNGWPARSPGRRFADTLARTCARLGAAVWQITHRGPAVRWRRDPDHMPGVFVAQRAPGGRATMASMSALI
jgi:hypothetical protein